MKNQGWYPGLTLKGMSFGSGKVGKGKGDREGRGEEERETEKGLPWTRPSLRGQRLEAVIRRGICSGFCSADQSPLSELVEAAGDHLLHNNISCKCKCTYIWYSTSSWNTSSAALRYGTCSRDLTMHMHRMHVHPQSEWAITAFPFTDPKGWKNELAWEQGACFKFYFS